MGCAASVPFVQKLRAEGVIPKEDEEDENEYAVFGTICHERGEEFLLNHKPVHVNNLTKAKSMRVNGKEKTYIAQNDDIQPHVQAYVNHVQSLVEEAELAFDEVKLLVEEKVPVFGTDCWGSCDAAIYVPGEELHIIDLKTGASIVEVKENPQFMLYALGMLNRLKGTVKRIFLRKVQIQDTHNPFAYWETTPKHLGEFAKVSKATIKASKDEKTRHFCIGDYCKWCPAHAHCNKHRDKILEVFAGEDDSGKAVIPVVEDNALLMPKHEDELSEAQLNFILRNREIIRKFLDKVEARILREAVEGKPLPSDYKVIQSKGKRRYVKTPEEITQALVEKGWVKSEDDLYTRKFMAMTEVEKKIGAGKLEQLGLVASGEGKLSIVPASHKAPSITASAIFDDEKAEIDDLM